MSSLYDHYAGPEKQKINIIKAAELYDKNNPGPMEALSEKLERRFKENVKPDSYLKIKSGIFGTKVQVGPILENSGGPVPLKTKLMTKKKVKASS